MYVVSDTLTGVNHFTILYNHSYHLQLHQNLSWQTGKKPTMRDDTPNAIQTFSAYSTQTLSVFIYLAVP